MTAPDYKQIATAAVDLLCRLGYLGLDPGQQRRLWQAALDLDRRLNPHRERIIVWTEEEGDVDPPRRGDGAAVPLVSCASCTPTGAERTGDGEPR